MNKVYWKPAISVSKKWLTEFKHKLFKQISKTILKVRNWPLGKRAADLTPYLDVKIGNE